MDAPRLSTIEYDYKAEPTLQERSDTLARQMEWLIGLVRRQYLLIVVITAISTALGVAHLMNTPPTYTAQAELLIDSGKVSATQQQAMPYYLPVDMTEIMTQIEILKSDSIALGIIKKLHLTDNPAFVGGTGEGRLHAVIARVKGLFGVSTSTAKLPDTRSETQLTRAALGTVRAQRDVTRVGESYVLYIKYTAGDPNLAAKMANAIADFYIDDKLDTKYQHTRRANKWLMDRIKDLRAQAEAADVAVLDYKRKNNIVDISGDIASSSHLLDDDRVSQINSQLMQAQAAVTDTRARLDGINEVMKDDVPDAVTADSLSSGIITNLRSRYLELASRERIFAKKYGASHLAVVNIRTQMAELRQSMHDELGRIAQGLQSTYEINKTRVQMLQKDLTDVISKYQSINRDRIGLRDLVTTAKIYHSIYDNFLSRYMETSQQQSFPITEARVISGAQPGYKSGPNTDKIIGAAVLIGLVSGFAAGFLREMLDRVFRTRHQVEAILRTNCLAVLPRLSRLAVAKSASDRDNALGSPEQTVSDEKFIADVQGSFSRVIDEPRSLFAEGFRSIKVAADIASAIKQNKIIGVTSSLPKEGKSTVASNLAQLMAHAGKRVVLVDGDLRNRTLSRKLTRDVTVGLLEVLGGQIELQQAVYTDSRSNLKFLPAVVDSRLAHTDEILGSASLKQMLDVLRKDYDYIIVDLPPLAPVSDARATAGTVDSYIYVVEWGRTKINVVQHQLAAARELGDRLLGVVLNKADLKRLTRYEQYYGRNYYKYYDTPYGYGSA